MSSPAAQPHAQLQVATLADEPNDGSSYEPPMGVPLLLPPSSVRRLPPPCWTPDETSCLIDSYRSKWLSLRRSNLRSSHWQEVAHDIHSRCPDVSPPKTAVQCRHKMEKLRKRYRSELLRANSIPHHRFNSSWIYFSKMESIDKPPASPIPISHHIPTPGFTSRSANSSSTPSPSFPDFDHSPVATPNYGLKPNYTLKTGYTTTPQSYGGMPTPVHSPPSSTMGLDSNYMHHNTVGVGTSGFHDNKRKMSPNGVRGSKSKVDQAALEMADAIKMVGEGFVRMEHMKMDMMRETERLRIDMEMKRTQMLLDSQHRILQAFAQGWSDIIHNQHPAS